MDATASASFTHVLPSPAYRRTPEGGALPFDGAAGAVFAGSLVPVGDRDPSDSRSRSFPSDEPSRGSFIASVDGMGSANGERLWLSGERDGQEDRNGG